MSNQNLYIYFSNIYFFYSLFVIILLQLSYYLFNSIIYQLLILSSLLQFSSYLSNFTIYQISLSFPLSILLKLYNRSSILFIFKFENIILCFQLNSIFNKKFHYFNTILLKLFLIFEFFQVQYITNKFHYLCDNYGCLFQIHIT